MLTVDDLKKIPTGGGGDLAGKCVRWSSGSTGKVKEGIVLYDGPRALNYRHNHPYQKAMAAHFRETRRGSTWAYNHRADNFASDGITVLMHRASKRGNLLAPHTFSPFRSQLEVITPEEYIKGLTDGVDQSIKRPGISYAQVDEGKVFTKTDARGNKVFRLVLGTGRRRYSGYSRAVDYLALKLKEGELVPHNTSCSPRGRGTCSRSSVASWATAEVTDTDEGKRVLAHPLAVEALKTSS